jgi:hypothetical protein
VTTEVVMTPKRGSGEYCKTRAVEDFEAASNLAIYLCMHHIWLSHWQHAISRVFIGATSSKSQAVLACYRPAPPASLAG